MRLRYELVAKPRVLAHFYSFHKHILSFKVLLVAVGICTLSPVQLHGQYYVEDEVEAVAPTQEWEVKILWVDAYGDRRRTKGWLMMAMKNSVIVMQASSGRSKHINIPARDIIKIKYKPAYDELPDILLGAADGALSGGFVPVSTGNPYFDILSGAVQGAIGGLINSAGTARTAWINRRPDVYTERVYPILSGR